MSDTADRTLDEAFASGNYHRVAASRRADRWQTYAALGLCGNVAPALDGLCRFDNPEARFYEGVIRWIDGDEDSAAVILEGCEGAHAARLLALIRKRRINILSQLPWSQFGEGLNRLLAAARASSKFVAQNIGFSPGDLQNSQNANIHRYYDANNPPDFYLAQMIEWQMIPPNLRELPCPIIGQTADFDMHIQTLLPWLDLFDTLIVTDMTEYADVARLTDTPVATFPKTFCLPASLPPRPPPAHRDIDILLTGTTFHSFHREKAEILHQILRIPGIEPFIMNGYLDWSQYYAMQSRARTSIAFIRHPGASPSRGIETLAMGTVLFAQPETTMRLWVDEAEGLLTYTLENQGLAKAIARVLADFPAHEAAARRGMEIIRGEFGFERLGAQYLRFATFLAARPQAPRLPAKTPVQKRVASWKGWLQIDAAVYARLRDQTFQTLQETPQDQQTVETLNDPGRETLLDYVQQTLTAPSDRHAGLITAILEIYRLGVELRPLSLVLRFNLIRAAFHFGGETDIEHALAVARETIAADSTSLSLDRLDDIMTWDYCTEFFNYRAYFDTVTESFMENIDRIAALKDLILASIEYYCGRITGDGAHFSAAAALDPEFSAYRLWRAKSLIREGDAESAKLAADLLCDLAAHSLYAIEAWTLLKSLRHEHGIAIQDGAAIEAAIHKLETRTLLDTDYEAIRNGPYFRTQRLGLARNEGYEVLKSDKRPARLSLLLADMNGSHYHRLVAALANQTLTRDAFEIIVVDTFDRISPRVREISDTIIVLGQNEHLYNRNAAFNVALTHASGAIVAYFDRDTEPEANALEALLKAFEGRNSGAFLVVNEDAEPISRHSLHFVALRRERALRAGGLDESPFRGAGLGGPYEFVERLQSDYPDIHVLEGISAPDKDSAEALADITPLLRDLEPYRFSPARRLPRNENPTIRELRESL